MGDESFSQILEDITLVWYKMGAKECSSQLEIVQSFLYYWISFNSLYNQQVLPKDISNADQDITKIKYYIQQNNFGFNFDQLKNEKINYRREQFSPLELFLSCPILNLKTEKFPFFSPDNDKIINKIKSIKVRNEDKRIDTVLGEYIQGENKDFYNNLKDILRYRCDNDGKKTTDVLYLGVTKNKKYLELEMDFNTENDEYKMNKEDNDKDLLFHPLVNFKNLNDGTNDKIKEQALTLIIYQIRNNLVHGKKAPHNRDMQLVASASYLLGKILRCNPLISKSLSSSTKSQES